MDIYHQQRKIIQFVEGRVFIDIAVSGCGSDCAYCYVDTKHAVQELIEEKDFDSILDLIERNPNFIHGKSGTILSLCPNTEPFKSFESARLVQVVLKRFLPAGNLIQIATKEVAPVSILDYISQNRLFKEQVVINISSSSISAQKEVEPLAADFPKRLENFKETRRRKIIACLYIKPVIPQTLSDLHEYIEIIREYNIDFVCIAPYYPQKEDRSVCKTLYKDKTAFNEVKQHQAYKVYEQFAEEFCRNKEDSCVVVYSTICVFSILPGVRPYIPLRKDCNEICSKCKLSCRAIHN